MTSAEAVHASLSRADVVKRKNYVPAVFASLIAAILLFFAFIVSRSGSISWSVVRDYLFHPSILLGVGMTIWLTVVAMVLGSVLGAVLAVMAMSESRPLKVLSVAYTWFFRGTPLLLQMVFWYNIALFVPRIVIGPIDVSTNELVTPYAAAILALSLHEGAYMAEVIRGGLLAVPKGQYEAASALGLTPWQTGRYIILKQVLRVIIPPTGNQAIGMLKTTSLVSVIAAQDLLTQAERIYATNYRVIELLMVAGAWYLLLTTVGSVLQHVLERRLSGSGNDQVAARIGGAA